MFKLCDIGIAKHQILWSIVLVILKPVHEVDWYTTSYRRQSQTLWRWHLYLRVLDRLLLLIVFIVLAVLSPFYLQKEYILFLIIWSFSLNHKHAHDPKVTISKIFVVSIDIALCKNIGSLAFPCLSSPSDFGYNNVNLNVGKRGGGKRETEAERMLFIFRSIQIQTPYGFSEAFNKC